jgi:hypothetical protein
MAGQPLTLYLSGSIRKGASDRRSSDYFWTSSDTEEIWNLTPKPIRLLNPALTEIDRSDPRVNFGCDLYLVSISDAVVVDLRRKKGIGVGAELAFADARRIPVFGLIGEVSEYRLPVLENIAGQTINNWTHPFVDGLCDEVFTSLGNLCGRITELFSGPGIASAYSKKIDTAIDYFLERNGASVRFHE